VNESIDDHQVVYIFAGSVGAYRQKVDQIAKARPKDKLSYRLVWREEDMLDMQKSVTPIIELAEDWYESPQLLDYRFKLLVTTGHL
jgi:hypothetical protein